MVPIYPFKCNECGKEFSVVCKMNEKEAYSICPDCESKNITQQVSDLNFTLVGKFS